MFSFFYVWGVLGWGRRNAMVALKRFHIFYLTKGKRKVQGVPQSQMQPSPDPKRKRKPTNPNKHKSNKRTKSTKISSLFPKR